MLNILLVCALLPAGDKVMVRIVHNLTLRPLNIARHLIPNIVWRLINFPLVISATLNVDHVSREGQGAGVEVAWVLSKGPSTLLGVLGCARHYACHDHDCTQCTDAVASLLTMTEYVVSRLHHAVTAPHGLSALAHTARNAVEGN